MARGTSAIDLSHPCSQRLMLLEQVGAAKYRQMRWAGETVLPPPVVLPQGINLTIPSREAGRDIPCRVIYPTNRTTEADRKKCKGSIMHFHGGGWVLADERSHDTLLQFYADTGDLAVVSVGYRLAPEDPFPKGPEDCMDAGEYLVKNSEKNYGGPLRFIGGEVR
jgi:acetyl esterase/lipase